MEEVAFGVATKVLEKLATKAYQEIALACGLEGDIESLHNSMKIISAFFMDAKKKQEEKHTSVAEWLKQLKDTFDDAIDILDEIEYEAKRNEVIKMYGTTIKKVCRLFSCSNPVAFRFKMAHKIKDIKQKIHDKTKEGKNLSLIEQHVNPTTHNQNLSWRETSSFVPRRVSGRDEEKRELINLLISPVKASQSQVDDIDVIPIVGIGGLGKTTLAQMVYGDNKVITHFEKRIWVCVSDDFDVKGLILKIIKEVDREERHVDNNSTLNQLQFVLQEKLQGKGFLLVLDDVWNENPKKWDDLKNCLLGVGGEMKSNGSKVIVTTRSQNIARIMGTGPQIKLEPLPEQECWNLFVKCAFLEDKEVQQYPMLEKIGREIVKRCKGVPLAVTTLGCLLKSKSYDENEWKKIMDSELWEIDHKDDGILPALRLSYNHLPPKVKQCFSYCSDFPKDHQYISDDLIMYWMAHGLLQPTNEKEEPEYLGKLCIKELVSASLLQFDYFPFDVTHDFLGRSFFKMHDLVHDLAMSTMKSDHVNGAVLNLSIPNNGDGVHHQFPSRLNKIRSIHAFHKLGGSSTNGSFEWIFNKVRFLRVLVLQRLKLHSLPDDCFARMRHLRLLDLCECDNLKKLPDSICRLHLLQSLLLVRCSGLQELPKNLRKLVSLRNLQITADVTSLSSVDIGSFKFLQSLVIWGCDRLVSLPREISHLTTLKKLIIIFCTELVSFEEEDEEERKQNEVVQDLSLQAFAIIVSPKLTALPKWLKRSNKTLQVMMIHNIGLTTLPEWFPSLTTLNYLRIEDCPELVAQCEKDVGPDWPKIAHVPHLDIEGLETQEESSEESKEESSEESKEEEA